MRRGTSRPEHPAIASAARAAVWAAAAFWLMALVVGWGNLALHNVKRQEMRGRATHDPAYYAISGLTVTWLLVGSGCIAFVGPLRRHRPWAAAASCTAGWFASASGLGMLVWAGGLYASSGGEHAILLLPVALAAMLLWAGGSLAYHGRRAGRATAGRVAQRGEAAVGFEPVMHTPDGRPPRRQTRAPATHERRAM